MTGLSVGSLAGWLTLVALVATAYIVWRGGGAAAISTLQAANIVLKQSNESLKEELRIALGLVADLKASRDIEQTLMPVKETLARLESQSERQTVALEALVAASENGRTPG